MDWKLLLREIKKDKNIVAVYLFGSQVKGNADKKSDYDIAFLCKYPPKNEWNYISKFSCLFIKETLDIKILNENALFFQFLVIETGKVLYCSNHRKRIEYEAHLISEYQDYKPYLDYYDKCMYKHIMEGSYGYGL
ncbi:MAG: nucleotidyltransferase domain-containing protein [Elusimicrobiota bacterium]